MPLSGGDVDRVGVAQRSVRERPRAVHVGPRCRLDDDLEGLCVPEGPRQVQELARRGRFASFVNCLRPRAAVRYSTMPAWQRNLSWSSVSSRVRFASGLITQERTFLFGAPLSIPADTS